MARLTEIVLLGNIACLAGEKLTYNVKSGRTNSDTTNMLLVRRPREGWDFGYDA